MNNAEDYCPTNKSYWRKWLQMGHDKKEGIWLIFNKKKSSNYNLSWSESVDVALCFGWIDSTQYKQYFSKRKAKSNWSKILALPKNWIEIRLSWEGL